VSSAVDEPSHVESPHVTEHGGDEPRVGPSLAPAVDRDKGGQDKADKRHKNHVVPVDRGYHEYRDEALNLWRNIGVLLTCAGKLGRGHSSNRSCRYPFRA